jgi:hypothetical protein
MKKFLFLFLIYGVFFTSNAVSGSLSGGTIQYILTTNKGELVTIKMRSGSEFTGKIVGVNGEIVHITELAGMEYYDAAASIKNIESIVIRAKK